MKTLLFITLFSFSFFLSAQTTLEPNDKVVDIFHIYKKNILNRKSFVWGVSGGITFDISTKRNSAFRLFLSGSIARNVIQKDHFNTLGSLQTEIEFFRGGLGTSVLNDERYKIHAEMRIYPQLVFGLDYGNKLDGRPMTISIGQSMSTLYDPFDGSITIGTCFINGLNHKRNQQLGFLMLGIRNFQGFYANDGPPFGMFGLGDKFDRLWTGSGQLGLFFLNDYSFFTDYAIRYDKFTGYQPNIYELGYTLQVDNLPYYNNEIQYYNQSRYQLRLGIRNSSHLTISLFNPNSIDMQDLIHYKLSMPYHVKPMGKFWTFGLDYQYKYIKIAN
ncbi:MAG: hypothetical protein AB8H03_17250 [Saprospiraceae bacterium]